MSTIRDDNKPCADTTRRQHPIRLAAVIPILFAAVAVTPVDFFGCRLRGLIAVSIALIGALLAVTSAAVALIGRMRGKPDTVRWMISALILALPAVAIVVMIR